MRRNFGIIVGAITFALVSSSAMAAKCSNNGSGFDAFKRDFAKEAKAAGIGRRGLSALAGTQYSPGVIKYDRSVNRSFKRAKTNFPSFYAKKTKGLLGPTRKRLKSYSKLLNQVEANYGVPKEVLVTIWGMETGFGGFTGKHDIVTSLASLTHDCRRSGFFKPNLMAALLIIDKGWIDRKQMRGARHGEIGQTQFMAKNYVQFGVDYDRDGRRDLIRSVPDVLASTANYLRAHGWRAGQSYGPGTHNFRVLKEWNASSAYQQAIAKFAASL
ncbi:MAG: lytic murein transglycosylase [Hyphomicrobiales bacterium]